MATSAPTSGWSSAVSLTPGLSYSYTATPAAKSGLLIQWSADQISWTSFADEPVYSPRTGRVPGAANYLRGMSFGAAGSFDAVLVTETALAIVTALANGHQALIQLDGSVLDTSVIALKDNHGSIITPISTGAYFPKRLRRGTYGRIVARWGALQNTAGAVSLVAPPLPLPLADNSTLVLRVQQNAALSFGQQSPPEAGYAVLPRGVGASGFNAGIWILNQGTKTLNFELRFFNVPANKNVYWFAAVDPASNWQFITLSAPQMYVAGGWTFGVDAINYARVTQKDDSFEGAWAAGDNLYFGPIYVDCAARPRFLLTFDDGSATQCARTPTSAMKLSGASFVSSAATNVLSTAAAHTLVVGEPLVFTEGAPTGLTTNTVYWVRTTPTTTSITLATDNTLATQVTGIIDGAYTGRYQYGGSQARSVQELVESYGFRGSLFIVPGWLGGSYGYPAGQIMTAADVQSMSNVGWAVGSHSNTHPSNNESAGLRLLGPYGFFLSNTFDNLPAKYCSNFNLTAVTGRRRVTSSTQASPSVFTTENSHRFLINQPLVFTEVAPTGCSLGVTYYVSTVPSATTFTLATDQSTLIAAVNNTTGAWSGVANYRWPGSANDDSAILKDIVDGANGVNALGSKTGFTFFALPQGAADEFVRSACIKAGIKWVRGVETSPVRTIPIGAPSGIVSSLIPTPGGWLIQPDAIQTDGAQTPAQIDTYVQDTIVLGACGCNYHHNLANSTIAGLDRLCQTLRTKSDAGLIEVMTLDEFGRELGL